MFRSMVSCSVYVMLQQMLQWAAEVTAAAAQQQQQQQQQCTFGNAQDATLASPAQASCALQQTEQQQPAEQQQQQALAPDPVGVASFISRG
jgi:hypothetical protein